MKVVCILDIDEDMLRNSYSEHTSDYNHTDAFISEIHSISTSGITLDWFDFVNDDFRIEDMELLRTASV
jgi:hypothetical protein